MALLHSTISTPRQLRHAALIAVLLLSAVLVVWGAGAHAADDGADVSTCSGSSPYYTPIEHEHTRSFLDSFRESIPALKSLWRCHNFCVHPGIQCTQMGLRITLNASALSGSLPELPNNVDGFHVVLLSLTFVGKGERLTGSLPVSWNLLTRLSSLDIGATSLSGTLPETWGTSAERRVMTRSFIAPLASPCGSSCLTSIRLEGNHLSGTLPESWARMQNLQEIWINDNLFTGTLPSEWSSLPHLRSVNARHNLLSGTLPPEWSSMPRIREITVDHNNFCGCIPDSWKQILDLTIDADEPLWQPDCAVSNTCDDPSSSSAVDECYAAVPFYDAAQRENTRNFLNAFMETIPALREMWVCPNFCAWPYVNCIESGVAVAMADVPFAGSLPDVPSAVDARAVVVNSVDMSNAVNIGNEFPATWGALLSMKYIAVPGTLLFGNLPPEWGSMSSLEYFDASSTMLFGLLPNSWSSLKKLKVLRISEAMLTGTLPDSWSEMSSLRELNLSWNTLDGPLPPSWSTLTNLSQLQLQQNILQGTLPKSWRALTDMKNFRVDNNQLFASIPEYYSDWENLANANLKFNNFCGCIPSRWASQNGLTLSLEADPAVIDESCATTNNCYESPQLSSSSAPSSSSSAPSSSSSVPSSSSSSAPSSSSSKPSSSTSSSGVDGGCFGDVPYYTAMQVKHSMRFLSAFADAFEDASETWRCPNFCAWVGVTCRQDGFSLELAGAVQAGALPEVPEDCDALEVPVRRISAGGAEGGVSLRGSLPSSWSGLWSLADLDFSYTGVGGVIPSVWSALVNLRKLNLGYNKLVGVLPPEWSGMASMEELYLNDNQLSGGLPLEWYTMENLKILDLSNNQLGGSLPGFIVSLSRSLDAAAMRKRPLKAGK